MASFRTTSPDRKRARMASQENSIKESAARNMLSAMSRLINDTDNADFTLSCGEKEWKVHSAILAVRSHFFKAAIANNMAEKLQMKMEIVDLDPEGMEQVINYMYGIPVGKTHFSTLLEASERFQMDDLKEDLIKIGIQSITKKNAVEIGKLGELYNSEQLLQKSAQFIVRNGVEMKEIDLSPKLTVRVLSIYKETVKTSEEREIKATKKSEEKASKVMSLRHKHSEISVDKWWKDVMNS